MADFSIGIDAHSLTGQKTGVATYVDNLLRGLAVSHRGEIELFSSGEIAENYGFKVRLVRGKRLWTTFWLGNHFLFNRKRPSVMLYPAHGLPWYSPMKNVVVIHDLAFELFPEHFTPSDLRRLKVMTRRAVKKADKIIAVSNSAKADLVRLYGLSPGKISVVYHGCDHSLFKPGNNVEILKRKYTLTKPYVISVGTLQRRKNHATLVRAWQRLRDEGVDIDLVLVGAKGWLSEELGEAINGARDKQSIHLLGYVDKEDLPGLYEGAKLFALPSLYEGFGMPVLEAMACGTPVVTSDNSSLGELYRGTAITINATDETELATEMKRLITDDNLRKKLVVDGIDFAREFDWSRTAAETYEVLRGYQQK